ncbi:MAG: response regulator [Deltaproteobacteria bacterium]|nr:response regulator [Deltaproteobacteria bacterium]
MAVAKIMDEVAASSAATTRDEKKVDILLVDDEPSSLLALEAILGSLGQNLVKAASGREALRHLMTREFAVILLDVQMPRMDGYETAQLIGERPSSRHTPIIFLTASHKADVQVVRGYAAGAVDYLFKPLDAEVLRSKVSVFVEMERKAALIRTQAAELAKREIEARQIAEVREQLVLDLGQKNRDLEAANKELETFSYSVSHDLRAPLHGIDGFSQLLLDDYAERLDEVGKKYLQCMRETAQNMAEMIDGLLALARVTRTEIQREPVDLTGLARDVIRRIENRTLQPPRRVEILVDEGLSCDGDTRLLTVVLENLIGNAWKFTSKQPDARIEIGWSPVQTAYFVRDNGAGFDMVYAGKLFGAFQRLHTSTEFEGHGIGLATVQRIVRRLGGQVWAEARIGAGATFFFTLAKGAEK